MAESRRSRYPFPANPVGWYAVAWSKDVRRGQSCPVRAFGRDLVVFRGEDGAAHVLDAICPHLGAHLGVASRVVGNTLECPFHAWRFDGAGACVDIPYVKVIPLKARVDCWPVREVNGAIAVWYHPRKEPPSFELPDAGEFATHGWSRPWFRTVQVQSHVQEMNENAFDPAHFVRIHHYWELPEVEASFDGAVARSVLKGHGRYAGLRLPLVTTTTLHGPGLLIVHAVTTYEVKVLVWKTPLDEGLVEHRYAIYFRNKLGPIDWLVRPFLERQITADVLADKSIWDHKVHLPRPLLVKPEGVIMRFREWHAQFYSEPSSG